MSAFGDLFRHFPHKVQELCLDECFMERRPVYYFEHGVPYAEQRPVCEVCGNAAIFRWSEDRYDAECFYPPLPDLSTTACENEQCFRLLTWFKLPGREGNRRRAAYKNRFGERWYMQPPGEERAARMALVMLEFTIRERTNEENGRRAA